MKSHQILPPSVYFTLAIAASSFLISSIAIAQTSRQLIELDVQPGFTSTERERLNEAARLLNSRFSSFDYGDDDTLLRARAYELEPRAREILKLLDCYPEMELYANQLLRNTDIQMSRDEWAMILQILVLAFLPGQNEGGVYELRINPVSEPSTEDGPLLMGEVAWSQAYRLNIDCEPGATLIDGSGFHHFGEFEMKINKYALRLKTASEIAGTLLHEMLHILGHNHPDPEVHGNALAYSEQWQINAITDSISIPGGFSKEIRNGNALRLYSNP